MQQTGAPHRSKTPQTVAQRLRAVVAPGGIVPLYQPIVDLRAGTIMGYEALSRPAPGTGYDNAGALFRDAEHAGLQWPVEEAARSAALAGTSDWPEGARLFFNCSPAVLADARFVETIARDIGAHASLTPRQVVLELTERSGPAFAGGLVAHIEQLKAAGFDLAIDDVGAGTSGLARIMLLRPQWLKLDRDLVEGAHRDPFKQNLLRFFVHFARLSGVRVVAEGIEEEAELETLVTLGIGFAQGYYLGAPGRRDQPLARELASWLRERWDAAESARVRDGRMLPVGRFVGTALALDAGTPVHEAAAIMLRAPEEDGAVALHAGRALGWCDRAAILRAGETADAGATIADIARPADPPTTPDTSVASALQRIAARADGDLARPVLVSEAGRYLGIARPRDLLLASVSGGSGERRTTPLTGLPGRVEADRWIGEELERLAAAPGRTGAGVAFVDIRRFADFNGAYGYELGDKLLRDLGQLLTSVMGRLAPGGRVFHVGDDRFILVADDAALAPAVQALTAEFDSTIAGTPRALLALLGSGGGDGSSAGPVVGLRVLVVGRAMSRIHSVRELYRFEQALRARSRAEERHEHMSGSIVIRDGRTLPERRSA